MKSALRKKVRRIRKRSVSTSTSSSPPPRSSFRTRHPQTLRSAGGEQSKEAGASRASKVGATDPKSAIKERTLIHQVVEGRAKLKRKPTTNSAVSGGSVGVPVSNADAMGINLPSYVSKVMKNVNIYSIVDTDPMDKIASDLKSVVLPSIIYSRIWRGWLHGSVLLCFVYLLWESWDAEGKKTAIADLERLYGFLVLPIALNFFLNWFCYPDGFFSHIYTWFDGVIIIAFHVPLLGDPMDLTPYQRINILGSLMTFRIVSVFLWFSVTECMSRGLMKVMKSLLELVLLLTLLAVIMAIVGFRWFSQSSHYFETPFVSLFSIFHIMTLEKIVDISSGIMDSGETDSFIKILFGVFALFLILGGSYVGFGLIESIVASSVEMEIKDLESRLAAREAQKAMRNADESSDLKRDLKGTVDDDDSSTSEDVEGFSDLDGVEAIREFSPTLADVVDQRDHWGTDQTSEVITFFEVMVTMEMLASDLSEITSHLNDILLGQFLADEPQYNKFIHQQPQLDASFRSSSIGDAHEHHDDEDGDESSRWHHDNDGIGW
ncbi:unnamed protein product [Notodromas monacha]|uniref:Ion transport domain-containing protein n=1 Tax=Notodromas monacha TaxID=399045 RepID=A0A7R9BCB9_9CRUS|nr:unnamed protein product [Notodromas monacha]CAG0912609.1 unnamed protein product [Notodromas monacha]